MGVIVFLYYCIILCFLGFVAHPTEMQLSCFMFSILVLMVYESKPHKQKEPDNMLSGGKALLYASICVQMIFIFYSFSIIDIAIDGISVAMLLIAPSVIFASNFGIRKRTSLTGFRDGSK